jgi:putative transposase
VERAREQHGLSERHACRLLGQWRGTQRYEPDLRLDEDALTREVIALAAQYGRYGYRRITALLQRAGWEVGKDRVQRIWRREGLKVPQKQKPRGRLWLNDGSCVRLRPERPNHVWSYDFVSARTHEGRTLRLLTLIDEYTRECLAIRVERRMGSQEVIETLSDVMLWRGIPGAPSFRQRSRVRGSGAATTAGEAGDRDAVHRTRQSLGERVLREF